MKPVSQQTRDRLSVAMRGNQNSAGMRNTHFRHGMYGTPAHTSWKNMMQRSTNPRHPDYLKVCDRWLDSANFHADMGVRPAGTSLDRINVDGDYEPGNCKWSTPKEQANNRRCQCGCEHCC